MLKFSYLKFQLHPMLGSCKPANMPVRVGHRGVLYLLVRFAQTATFGFLTILCIIFDVMIVAVCAKRTSTD